MAKAVKISGMKENTSWWLLGLGVLGGGGYLLYRSLRKPEAVWPEGDQGPPTADQQWPPAMGDDYLIPVGTSNGDPGGQQAWNTPPLIDYATPPKGTESTPPRTEQPPVLAELPAVTVPNSNFAQIKQLQVALARALQQCPGCKAVFDHIAEMGKWWATAAAKYKANDPMGGSRSSAVADERLRRAFEASNSIAMLVRKAAMTVWLNFIKASWEAWKADIRGDKALADKYRAEARQLLGQITSMMQKAAAEIKKAEREKQQRQANGNGNSFKVLPGATGSGSGVAPVGPIAPPVIPPVKMPVATSSVAMGGAKPSTQAAPLKAVQTPRLITPPTAPTTTNSGGAMVKDTVTRTAQPTTAEARKNQVQSTSSMTVKAAAVRPTAQSQAPRTVSTPTVADQIRANRNGTVQTAQGPVKAGTSSVTTVPAKVSVPTVVAKVQPVTTTGASTATRPATTAKLGEPQPKQTVSRPVQATQPIAPPATVPIVKQASALARPVPVQRSIAVAAKTTPANASKQAARAVQTATLAQQQASAANRSLALLRRV